MLREESGFDRSTMKRGQRQRRRVFAVHRGSLCNQLTRWVTVGPCQKAWIARVRRKPCLTLKRSKECKCKNANANTVLNIAMKMKSCRKVLLLKMIRTLDAYAEVLTCTLARKSHFGRARPSSDAAGEKSVRMVMPSYGSKHRQLLDRLAWHAQPQRV